MATFVLYPCMLPRARQIESKMETLEESLAGLSLATSEEAKSTKIPPFLALPAELRIMIYELAKEDQEIPLSDRGEPSKFYNKDYRGTLALLYTCSRLRQEVQPWLRNWLSFDTQELEDSQDLMHLVSKEVRSRISTIVIHSKEAQKRSKHCQLTVQSYLAWFPSLMRVEVVLSEHELEYGLDFEQDWVDVLLKLEEKLAMVRSGLSVGVWQYGDLQRIIPRIKTRK